MKKFLAVYMGSASGIAEWKKMDEDKRKRQEKAGMEAWSKWATANQKSIVDQGSPLGKTKRISKLGISDTKNELAAYTIVQADHMSVQSFLRITRFHDITATPSRSWNFYRCRRCNSQENASMTIPNPTALSNSSLSGEDRPSHRPQRSHEEMPAARSSASARNGRPAARGLVREDYVLRVSTVTARHR